MTSHTPSSRKFLYRQVKLPPPQRGVPVVYLLESKSTGSVPPKQTLINSAKGSSIEFGEKVGCLRTSIFHPMGLSNWWLWAVLVLAVLGVAVDAYPRGKSSAAATRRTPAALDSFFRTLNGAKKHLLSAAVARSISIFGMYPIDTIKTRIQIEQPNPFRPTGLYGGVTGSLMGQVPYGVLVFGSYEIYKQKLQKRFPNARPIGIFAMASLLGDLTGSLCLCPSEVIKQKLQAGLFRTETEAFLSIWKSRGLFGFYEGYTGALVRDIPFRVAQLTTFETVKKVYLRFKTNRSQKSNTLDPVELSALEAVACGALAGSIAAAITSPLDRIKTILMTDGAAYGGTVISCATKILQEEGLRGLTTGMGPRVLYIAPSVAIFFVAYEACQQKLKNWT